MNSDDLKPRNLFTKDGDDVWELMSCYQVPSCTLKNLRTGEEVNFGIGALTAESFHRITMPEIKNEQT